MAQLNTRWRSPASSPVRSGSPAPSTQQGILEIPRETIAQRAYEKFLARGGQDGGDMKDWLEAERELKAEYFRQRTRN